MENSNLTRLEQLKAEQAEIERKLEIEKQLKLIEVEKQEVIVETQDRLNKEYKTVLKLNEAKKTFFEKLSKINSKVQLTETQKILSKTPSRYFYTSDENGETKSERWESEDLEIKCPDLEISYLGYKIRVHEVYNRYSYKIDWYAMNLSSLGYEYQNRKYKSAKTVITKIDEHVEAQENRKKAVQKRKEVNEVVRFDFVGKYPNADILIDTEWISGYHGRQGHSQWYIRITFPNKNFAKYYIHVDNRNDKGYILSLKSYKDFRIEEIVKDSEKLLNFLEN